MAAPELPNESVHVDADLVARYLDLSLKDLVTRLVNERTYKTVYKTPADDAAQVVLRPVLNTVAMLRCVFAGDRTVVLQWLRTPRAD